MLIWYASVMIMTTIQDNLRTVHQRLSDACAAAGRDPRSVTLLAVSKTQGAATLRATHHAGQTAFGENYVQEALTKMAALRDLPLEWHCIGPLQSNKTRLVAEQFDWVHSVDRLKTALRLSEQRPAGLPPLQICLQVNLDGGETKAGIGPAQAAALALQVSALPRLCLRGIMTIPEPASGFEAQKAVHLQAKRLFDEIRAALEHSGTAGAQAAARFDTLSMGMTGDLEAAVHAGSTLVRIGTAIFGARATSPEPGVA